MTYSKNGIGLAIIIVEFILSALGIEFEAGTVAKAVEGTLLAAALLLTIWNQLSRSNTKWFLFKS